ncbi:MAG: murein biosynthesis integral membrane protein MurJ [Alphaproteobacteria bacterium]|nr:murein biosynthesis integral membrane protein MurJ [Alphaproteobacteria bacterium]
MANKGLFKNTVVVGIITLISRISGLFRDFFVAKYLGAGRLSDCFLVAFKIPNLFRSIFAEGAFNSAFVPIFSGVLYEKSEDKAKLFCKNLFAFLFYILLVFTLIAEIFMPFVINIFAPGFNDNPEKFELAVSLAHITFPFLFCIALTSFFGSILNTLGNFKPYALTPIILNLSMIFSLVFFANVFPSVAHTVSWGVAFSGILQLVILWWIAKKYGFGIISFKPKFTPEIGLFFRKIIPGILGAGIYHLNVMIGSIFASETNGAVSWIYYADRLNQLPLGVIGVALATVLLPSLSKEIRKHNLNKTKAIFNDSMKFASLLVIPSALGIISLSYPMIQIFFERGEFKVSDTLATSNILQILCLSLPALVYTKLFSNVFYARNDTKTPMFVAGISLIFNVFFTIYLNRFIGYSGVVIAITISNWINCILLYLISYKNGFMVMYLHVIRDILKITLISILMALIVRFGVWGLMADISVYSLPLRIFALTLLIFIGALFFISGAIITKAISISELKKIIKR